MRDEFKSYCHEGDYPHVIINNRRETTKVEHIAVLKRIRKSIVQGIAMKAENSNDIGNKYTHCDWGLCSERKEYWPTPELHTWPQYFVDTGRVAPLDPPPPLQCPMRLLREKDIKAGKGEDSWGCLYQCRVFQTHFKTPSRKEALELYDIMIAELEGQE